jgi:hypothetical protein
MSGNNSNRHKKMKVPETDSGDFTSHDKINYTASDKLEKVKSLTLMGGNK